MKDKGFMLIEALICFVIVVILFAIVYATIHNHSEQVNKPAPPPAAPAAENHDPRLGWVKINEGFWKVCDGTNLIYNTTDGPTAITDAKECLR